MKSKKTNFCLLFIFCIISAIFSCTSESSSKTDESQNFQNSETKTDDNSQVTDNSTSTVIWSGAQDFNDSGWAINIQISADKFASFTEGNCIQIEWYASSTATSYKKLQLDSMGSSWTELTGGSYSGGHTESGENSAGVVPDSSPLTYTVTSSNAASLKENGFALMGYGVVVTKIVLVSGDSSSSSTDGTTQTADSSNTGSDSTTSDVTTKVEPTSVTGTPYANHGKLHVTGAYLYDVHNQKYQLYGMSTHGLNFGDDFSRYVNEDAFKTLVDDWNTNCIRLVLYPKDYNGYCNGGDQANLRQIVKNGIEYAANAGMYVLVDWHVHQYNPNDTKDEAKTFLAEIAEEYANYGNVLYEICNEPTGSEWDSVLKPYAEEVIPVIRQYASDAVIIVGTNTWSQDIEGPLANPLSFSNVMYTFHFYANSHTDSYRTRVENAVNAGLPVFITEFGTCDASGNGGFNESESQKWFDLCKKYSISHLNWSLSNKGETASAILSSCSKTSGWSDDELTESGKLVKNHFATLER
ncbi:glycoside hydrolase family 5 protein [Treponema sp.]|uniref:glycoside hydrolase family 5 protein n=1 Tax=Treponema sp. TaxID=166 RepID=UPI00388DE2E2